MVRFRSAPLCVALALAGSAGCALVAGIDTFQPGLAMDGGTDATGPADATVDTSADAVVVETAAGDAGDAQGIDAAEFCPSLCADAGIGTCDDAGTCAVDCVAAGTCAGPIVCPAGIPCTVTCTGAGSCTSTIDCTSASACKIDCIGASSCTRRIACSGSTCAVDCVGAFSCMGGVCCDAGSCTGTPTACQ